MTGSPGRVGLVIEDPQTATVISVAGRLRHPRFARARANSSGMTLGSDSYRCITNRAWETR